MAIAETDRAETDRAGTGLTAAMRQMGLAARAAARDLALADPAAKNHALRAAAGRLMQHQDAIAEANRRDLAFARDKGVRASLIDRLVLTPERVQGIANGLTAVAGLDDPVGAVMAEWQRPNGLAIQRVRVPLGVIGIIYESRPNVTADAGGLCLKSGNAAILRGGSESLHSSRAIVDCLHHGLAEAGLPERAVQLVPTRDRAAVGEMLRMDGLIDIIVPRGGRSLIERVSEESRMPVIAHLDGLCHVYIDGAAEIGMARAVALNAKMRRTSVCGAAETLLVDRAAAATHLPPIVAALREAGCEIRGDAATAAIIGDVVPANDADWVTEYLDAILSVRVVDGVEAAIEHINRYGSNHTDSIVTADRQAAERFLQRVDSAIVLHNASTQYADGGEFGMGAEIGISTGRLHARGPVGVEQLTSFKYVVRGSGQTRP